MEKKYELTSETCKYNGHTLYRIKALKDFGNVKEGNLGGFVECEDNLSQEGNCWVDDEAKVYNNAKVYGDAGVKKLTCEKIVDNNFCPTEEKIINIKPKRKRITLNFN